jgi:phenylacetic acid degradation protein
MLYEFNGHRPVVDASSFVHPQAAVTGNVIIGKRVYIGPGAAIRGDWGQIVIEDGCNVQENCTIHMFPGVTVRLKEGAHIGHGAIVHGATIGRNCLIGMNAVIMDGVVVGDECIIGALSFVKAGEKIPARSVMAGNPAKMIKQVSDELLHWKTEGTAIYARLPKEMQESWKTCEALLPGEKAFAEAGQEAGDAGTPGEDGEKPSGAKAGPVYRPWEEFRIGTPKVEEPAAGYGHGKRTFTIEDYLGEEEGSNQRHEYYQGEIFLMSGAKADHNRIVMSMAIALAVKLKGSPCEVFNADQRVHVQQNTLFTYPDLSIVCGEPEYYNKDSLNLTNPAVIVEVLSPSTKNYERGDKMRLYQDLPSLREYIMVDSQAVLVEHFAKDEQNEWVLKKYDRLDDTFLVGTAGVSLSVAEIYEKARFLKVTQ